MGPGIKVLVTAFAGEGEADEAGDDDEGSEARCAHHRPDLADQRGETLFELKQRIGHRCKVP